MTTTPLAPTVPPSNDPSNILPLRVSPAPPPDGSGPDGCPEYLEELVQRLGDLEAFAVCAAMLLVDIPRDPSPSAEAPMRRVWRLVERVAMDAGAALQYAVAAVAVVRSSHKPDDSNGGGAA